MRMFGRTALFACFWMVSLAASAQSLGCNVADISLDKLNHRVKGEFTYVSGRIVSNCAQSTGVHLRVSLFDSTGNILAAQDFWPASVKNIPPRGVFPFEAVIRGAKNPTKFSVVILQTKVWPRS